MKPASWGLLIDNQLQKAIIIPESKDLRKNEVINQRHSPKKVFNF